MADKTSVETYRSMDSTFKKIWVSALLSKEFHQGRQALRRAFADRIEFCCLGVLCESYYRHTGQGKWVVNPLDDSTYRFLLDGTVGSGYPPSALYTKVQLDQTASYKLAHLNDFLNYSFVDIAKWIEENL